MKVNTYPGDMLLWLGQSDDRCMTNGKIYICKRADNNYSGSCKVAVWTNMDDGRENGWLMEGMFLNITQLLKEE